MKRKDMNVGKRAWEDFKFVALMSSIGAFGFGAFMIVLVLAYDVVYPLLLFLICPICIFIAWKLFPKQFLKEDIEP